MSIEYMTFVSRFLLIVSALFAVTAVVMFFAMDIPRCWKMVFGRESIPKRQSGTMGQRRVKNRQSKKSPSGIKTVLLHNGTATELEGMPSSMEETLLLDHTGAESTELLEFGEYN